MKTITKKIKKFYKTQIKFMEETLKSKKRFRKNIENLISSIKQIATHLNKENIISFLKGLNQPTVAIISILLIIIIAAIDHITVYDFGFYVLYYIPLIFFSWYSNKIGATLISIFAINALYLANFHQSYQFTLTFKNIWNLTLILASFLLVSIGAQHVSSLLKTEKALTNKLRNALNEIKQLSGLLPICASCKKIRNDKGYWEQIEEFISKHSDATFTHGICPECMKKQYPYLVSELEKNEQHNNTNEFSETK